jgi:hypothetical protein
MNASMTSFARERMMHDGSLRSLVDKWLAPTQATPARVTRIGRMGLDRTRFVRLEALCQERPIASVFQALRRHMTGISAGSAASHDASLRKQ